ncbi:MAG: hypothetical protein PHT58_05565 [Eubacteriales bacterium]|nr:hypothetical protein [Eubacteriales bacterium]
MKKQNKNKDNRFLSPLFSIFGEDLTYALFALAVVIVLIVLGMIVF